MPAWESFEESVVHKHGKGDPVRTAMATWTLRDSNLPVAGVEGEDGKEKEAWCPPKALPFRKEPIPFKPFNKEWNIADRYPKDDSAPTDKPAFWVPGSKQKPSSHLDKLRQPGTKGWRRKEEAARCSIAHGWNQPDKASVKPTRRLSGAEAEYDMNPMAEPNLTPAQADKVFAELIQRDQDVFVYKDTKSRGSTPSTSACSSPVKTRSKSADASVPDSPEQDEGVSVEN